jgi:hypothetical protein
VTSLARRHGPAVAAAALVVFDVAIGLVLSGLDPIGFALTLFGLVGALIVWRQPGNRMGWVFAATGVVAAVGSLVQVYAEEVLPTLETVGAFGVFAAWVTGWWWWVLLGLMIIYVPLLFPTGRPPGPRWRWLARLAALDIGLLVLLSALAPTLDGDGYSIDNPIGVPLNLAPEASPVGGPVFGVLLICIVGAAVSVFVRFRRSRGVERQQLKWFVCAVMLIPVTALLEEFVKVDLFQNNDLPFAIALSALPVAAGLAILRFGLYQIDVVINRALVYGSLTISLAAAYLVLVTLVQALIPLGGSDIGVAASTLAVAAAVAPLRKRIQATVDRRFYRRKYDAKVEYDAFVERLRREVALDDVLSDLGTVVGSTLQPATMNVWLRSPGLEKG